MHESERQLLNLLLLIEGKGWHPADHMGCHIDTLVQVHALDALVQQDVLPREVSMEGQVEVCCWKDPSSRAEVNRWAKQCSCHIAM